MDHHDVASARFIRWFSSIHHHDVALVGGKNASLGEMYQHLNPLGVRIPNGFAITAEAYLEVLRQSGLWEALPVLMQGLNVDDVADLAARAAKARQMVVSAPLPEDLQTEIAEAFALLKQEYGEDLSVAVRSSATAEDLPTASFAGQHDSYLNIRNESELLLHVQRCFASLFNDRAIRYRVDHGFDHFRVFLSVGVMKMVRSDRAASGVVFSLDTESGFRDAIFVTGAYGLGENVVQGAVDPDEFYVFKPTLKQGYRSVLRRNLGAKKIRMVYGDGDTSTRNEPTLADEQSRFCISDEEVLSIAEATVNIEDHYSHRAGHAVPMDIEWAKDALDGQIYIVQARPETVSSRKNLQVLDEYHVEQQGMTCRVSGHAVGSKAASGQARVILDISQLHSFRPGEILVADTTSPDWVTVMKMASAIVTNRGGRTCHAAIVARELGIPAVVGCEEATTRILEGDALTVSCCEGDIGRVYDGILPIHHTQLDLESLPRPVTRVMLNVGNPEVAFKHSFLPNDGVGLARMEFIINQSIHVHPMALLFPERVRDADERACIEKLIRHAPSPADFFVQRLSEGVATIAAAFHPKPVIVRMSDFKSNEYASLMGGQWFEPREENPMLGFRGASRYTHPAYQPAFELECAAIKRVRESMGLKNLRLMVPFCRRVEEAERVIHVLADQGLKRGEAGLEIYMMCEIPNNVLQLDAFAAWFDGFSIGSNDLTQLVLGVDRDSEMVAFEFDERDPGVKTMIRMTIDGAIRNKKHVGICGQAPSDYPEMAEFLVECGIESISLTPDAIVATTRHILDIEHRLGRHPRGDASVSC